MGKLGLVEYIMLMLPFTVFQEKYLAQRVCKLSGKVLFQP